MHRRPIIEMFEKILAKLILDPAADRDHEMARMDLPNNA
jgi:hypothetical protein